MRASNFIALPSQIKTVRIKLNVVMGPLVKIMPAVHQELAAFDLIPYRQD